MLRMGPFIYPMGEKDPSEISGQQHAMICLPRLLINIFVSICLFSAIKLGACCKQGQSLTVPSTMADIRVEAIHIPKANLPPSSWKVRVENRSWVRMWTQHGLMLTRQFG